MSKSEMKFRAQDNNMQPDEIMSVIDKARQAGFIVLAKTRVGFGGNIIEMVFRQPEVER